MKHLPEYRGVYVGNMEIYNQVRKRSLALEKWTREKKTNFVGLGKLKEYFGQDSISEESRLNRMAMYRILEDHMMKDILESPQIKNPSLYLQSAKVFKLRCRNATLAERNQCD